jgi:phosphomannomutase/phosphoglucomutase
MSDSPASPVFKAYDIRGIVPSQIDVTFAHRLGRVLGQQARQQGIGALVVGRDGRLSSPSLASALMNGLTTEGVDALDIGLVPTPVVYFAAHTLETGSGVAVTGSHNPADYNGFKLMMGGRTLHGDDISAIGRAMAGLSGHDRAALAGARRSLDILDAYVSRITGDVKLARPMKIAVDCGNGAGGAVAARLFEALGCRVDRLFCDVDGRFPNHHPDPSVPGNLRDLQAHLAQSDCELGLAFDGDADRLGVVARGGEIIWPDRQLILFARDVLGRHPDATIVYDVKCSRHVGQAIRAAGGSALMWKTGHSVMKAKLAESGAPLAGELSGHIFFKDRWYGFDDGLYVGARLLELLSRTPDASATLLDLPAGIATPELKIAMREGEPPALIARLLAEADFPTATDLVAIDGVRAEYPDGFGLARASNTTPAVTLRFEGDTPQALARIQDEFRAALRRLAPDATLPF